ncbi:MAG TPA: rod shape-determining protein MreD [Candidatus Portnoybacteria bacterium]|nr:rod shape-determining protein MreD [Candidatus Portnoybacteria bacterium]
MYPLLTILILFLAAVLETTFIPHLAIWGVEPSLVLIIVLSWSILANGKKALTWALLGGLFLDLFSGLPFGVFTLSFVIVAYLTNLVAYNILDKANLLVVSSIGLIGTITANLLMRLFLKLANLVHLSSLTIEFNFFRLVLLEAIYNTILILGIFWLLKQLKQWLSTRQGRISLPY